VRQAEWDVANAEVHAYLVLYCDGDALAVVHQYAETMDGHGAWMALQNKFQREGMEARVRINQKLHGTRMKNGEDPDIIILETEELFHQLDAMGHAVEEAMKIAILLQRLSRAYAQLKTMLECADQLTYEQAKKAISTFYRNNVEEGVQVLEEEGVTTALFAGRKGAITRIKCYGCGGMGHKRNECPNSGERTQGDFKYECWNCGEKGHKRSDCPGARKPAPKPIQSFMALTGTKKQQKKEKFDSWGMPVQMF
jgi:hypothetical protein